MKPMRVIAIFDIGKTNKKFFLFNGQYKIVMERSAQFPETTDEDGFPCDDVQLLTRWVKETLAEILTRTDIVVKAVNFSAYGASFVHINQAGEAAAPLYNYLKPYPEALQKQFYARYGGETAFSVATASPVLGSLNSGLQLYRLSKEKPALFVNMITSLHLPQYISYLVTGKAVSEITSIGCHTGLWDFRKKQYHTWVNTEGVGLKLPPLHASNKTIFTEIKGVPIEVGIGLHDSSAALIPYLTGFSEPFVLISTGTWCISLNPFNEDPLTAEELQQDCLCYLEYGGNPVKASRLFAGHEHEEQVKILAQHFSVPDDEYKQIAFVPSIFQKLQQMKSDMPVKGSLSGSAFLKRDLTGFADYTEAYHQLIFDIVEQQQLATSLVLGSKKVSRIFVDGGFAKNPLYMHMLAAAFPDREVFAASVSQATAIGAALAIHTSWNNEPIPGDMVELKYYTVIQ